MKIPNIFEKDTETETFAAGTIIFEEGQVGVVMYVVKSGEVELKAEEFGMLAACRIAAIQCDETVTGPCRRFLVCFVRGPRQAKHR